MPKVQVNGAELSYRDAGVGSSTVLLLHAFPLHGGMWSREIALLERRHRVIAPDYRGLGGSAPSGRPSTMEVLAEDVRALLAHLRVERAAVAGLSMGGYLAFELYRRMPALFRGLALCDTKATADGPEARATRETFARNALEKGLGWVADEMIPKLLRPGAEPQVAKEVRDLIVRHGTPAGVAAAQRGMAERPDSTPTLATIACPTLVIVGEDDALTPPAEAERMARAVKEATLVRIPRAGHLSNVERPDAFGAALSSFVDGLGA
jgi:pimeloyl-ACP methyl ester carboxylesterase